MPLWYTLPMAACYRLIELLADGDFHSGETLGERLSMTRTAVWKQVRQLEKLGLDVHAVRGRGYRLPYRLELLDRDRIQSQLSPVVLRRLHRLDLFHDIDSTSDYLKRECVPMPGGRGHACLAEWQHAGRGRRGRRWVSPYGSNLYLSLAWGFEGGLENLSGLSLAAAVAVLRALRKAGIEGAGLKWPNDILLGGGKLAGILLDMAGEASGPVTVVVGVGVNVHMPGPAGVDIDQPWSDLSQYADSLSRNRLAALLLDELVGAMEEFSEHGLPGFLDEWQQHDLINGQEIRLHVGDRVLHGLACGVDAQGALIMRDASGVRRYHAGEVSVRLNA